MKKRNFLMIVSAFMLAVAATVAAKTHNLFTVASTIYYTVGGLCRSFTVTSGNFTYPNAAGIQANITTANGTTRPLYANCSGGVLANAVYFNH